jgi:hypothetical protein
MAVPETFSGPSTRGREPVVFGGVVAVAVAISLASFGVAFLCHSRRESAFASLVVILVEDLLLYLVGDA